MTQDNQHADPETSGGGYGTPTAEQEMGGQAQQGGAPAGQAGAGAGGADTNEPQGAGGEPIPHDAAIPSADAEIDEANDDSQGSAPVSSEAGQEAAGIPDGSGSDLPQEETPNDDGGESFDAG